MKALEIKDLNIDELQSRLESSKKALFDLRMDKAAGKLTNTHKIVETRRDVARIATVLNEKLAQERAAGAKS